MRKIFDELHQTNQCEKIDINSKSVQQISKFTVFHKWRINCICPLDHSHAWLSLEGNNGLVLVSKEGLVTDTKVTSKLYPYHLALVGTTDILMTSNPITTFASKLSIHDKQVTTFADISPLYVCDLSIHQTGEVYVRTGTPEIVVLNRSGTIVRKVTFTENVMNIACMSAGIALSTGDNMSSKLFSIDKSVTIQT